MQRLIHHEKTTLLRDLLTQPEAGAGEAGFVDVRAGEGAVRGELIDIWMKDIAKCS
jgi:hypothetical protein